MLISSQVLWMFCLYKSYRTNLTECVHKKYSCKKFPVSLRIILILSIHLGQLLNFQRQVMDVYIKLFLFMVYIIKLLEVINYISVYISWTPGMLRVRAQKIMKINNSLQALLSHVNSGESSPGWIRDNFAPLSHTSLSEQKLIISYNSKISACSFIHSCHTKIALGLHPQLYLSLHVSST